MLTIALGVLLALVMFSVLPLAFVCLMIILAACVQIITFPIVLVGAVVRKVYKWCNFMVRIGRAPD